MLGYQHSYHAGNLADVHKHAMLAHVLDYMAGKDKPLSYIETHAGRGLYDLASPETLKTGEAAAGIATMEARFPAGHPYLHRLAETRARYGPHAYPGSPLLAALSLRDGDRMHLAELHPQEHSALREAVGPWASAIRQEDGLAMAQAVCPPTPRRGVLLIDPSYEGHDDYAAMPKALAGLHRKWNVGVLMLWYPLLPSRAHAPMLASLALTFPDALRHEVRFPALREGHRMTGSGLFIVNAPYGTGAEAARLTRLFDTPS